MEMVGERNGLAFISIIFLASIAGATSSLLDIGVGIALSLGVVAVAAHHLLTFFEVIHYFRFSLFEEKRGFDIEDRD
jgi:hypothetical protein